MHGGPYAGHAWLLARARRGPEPSPLPPVPPCPPVPPFRAQEWVATLTEANVAESKKLPAYDGPQPDEDEAHKAGSSYHFGDASRFVYAALRGS